MFPKEKMRNRNKEFKGERRSNVKSEREEGGFTFFIVFELFDTLDGDLEKIEYQCSHTQNPN